VTRNLIALLFAFATLSACVRPSGGACDVYGTYRFSVPPSEEFAVLDMAMTEACRP